MKEAPGQVGGVIRTKTPKMGQRKKSGRGQAWVKAWSGAGSSGQGVVPLKE